MVLSSWQLTAATAVALCVSSYTYTKLRAPGFRVADKHVFITGGSLGIGLEVAKKYAQAGARVSIVARNVAALEAAKNAIESVSKNGYKVFTQSCDVTDFVAVERAVQAATAFHGRVIDHLLCCAGYSAPGYFADQDIATHRNVMDVNYFGALHAVKAALPSMRETKLPKGQGKRRVVFVSSGLGLISWVGFASYSPSKFALRGLAEALRNEFILYDIDVSIYHPGNVITPGYEEQTPQRPRETLLIGGVSVEKTADSAAQSLINGIKDGQYVITNDVMIFLLRSIANGIVPRNNTPLEFLVLPLVLVIQKFHCAFMDLVVKRAKKSHEEKITSKPTEHTALV